MKYLQSRVSHDLVNLGGFELNRTSSKFSDSLLKAYLLKAQTEYNQIAFAS